MKNILIGICGIGNGHFNRERQVITQLLLYDVNIVIAAPKNMEKVINEAFPQFKYISVTVPWIYCNNEGIDFEHTYLRYIEEGLDQFGNFLKFAMSVQDAFGGEQPDIVMTDYEPNVAQYAYAIDVPLICIDQHSKFLILPDEHIEGHSVRIDKSRLLYFFPKADYRFVSSFVPLKKTNDYNIVVIPPIIKRLEQQGPRNLKKVVVYFSTYTSERGLYQNVLDLAAAMPMFDFIVYTNLCFDSRSTNVQFRTIGESFNEDLKDCAFIMCPAGHQLISEAIYMEIPLLVFPLDTYDQHFCAKEVERNGFGHVLHDFLPSEINALVDEADSIRMRMKVIKHYYWNGSWESIMFKILENEYGLVKQV